MVRKIEIERFSLTTSKQLDVPKIVRLLIGNPLIMKEWRSMLRMPVLTRRLRCLWMSLLTAFISHMTR